MKKHLSVLCLIARSSVYKILAVLICMAAVQAVLFSFFLGEAAKVYEAGLGVSSLEDLIARSHIGFVFAAAFLAVTFFLCKTGCALGAQPGYTLDRLSVSSAAVWSWQAAYNAAVYLTLWCFEAMTVLGLALLFIHRTDPSLVTGQTVMLAAYRSDFFHALIPVNDAAAWVRNAAYVLAMGIAAANFPFKQRQGRFAGGVMMLFCLVLGTFKYTPGEPGVCILETILVVFASAVSVAAMLGVFDEKTDREEEEP